MKPTDSKSRTQTLFGYVPPRAPALDRPTLQGEVVHLFPRPAPAASPKSTRKLKLNRKHLVRGAAAALLALIAVLVIPMLGSSSVAAPTPFPVSAPTPDPALPASPVSAPTAAAVSAPNPTPTAISASASVPGTADEKQAAELLLAGKAADALPIYEALAKAHPERGVFAAIAKQLSAELKTRSVP
jgi:hypothetical protein